MKVELLLSVFLLFATTACRHLGESRSDRCWSQLRGARVGSALTNQRRNAVADELHEQRCTELEMEERAETRMSHAERREVERQQAADVERRRALAEAERRAQTAATTEALARIRRTPRQPEIDGTIAEAVTLCRQQRGTSQPIAAGMRCTVGGVLLYACASDTISGVERLTRCDVYHEDADPIAFRTALTERFGEPDGESISSKGFRVFTWNIPGQVAAMTMYERGVRTTVMRSEEPGDGGAPFVEDAANPYVQ